MTNQQIQSKDRINTLQIKIAESPCFIEVRELKVALKWHREQLKGTSYSWM